MHLRALIASAIFTLSLSACQGAGAPTPEDLLGDELGAQVSAVNGNGNNGNNNGNNGNGNNGSANGNNGNGNNGSANGNNGNHYGWTLGKGNPHGGNGNGANSCSVVSEDPLAAEMPATRLHQSFEKEPLGPLGDVFRWYAGTQMVVTDEAAYEGQKSLKVISDGDVSDDYDLVGVKFCVRCEATERFKASFAVRFESFVDWNGFAVTNSPHLAYWWWIRSDGSVFDDETFSTLTAQSWHTVEIDIDRKHDRARLTIDGVEHEAPLSVWAAAGTQPMGCVRLLNVSESAQVFYVDDVKVQALK